MGWISFIVILVIVATLAGQSGIDYDRCPADRPDTGTCLRDEFEQARSDHIDYILDSLSFSVNWNAALWFIVIPAGLFFLTAFVLIYKGLWERRRIEPGFDSRWRATYGIVKDGGWWLRLLFLWDLIKSLLYAGMATVSVPVFLPLLPFFALFKFFQILAQHGAAVVSVTVAVFLVLLFVVFVVGSISEDDAILSMSGHLMMMGWEVFFTAFRLVFFFFFTILFAVYDALYWTLSTIAGWVA